MHKICKRASIWQPPYQSKYTKFANRPQQFGSPHINLNAQDLQADLNNLAAPHISLNAHILQTDLNNLADAQILQVDLNNLAVPISV